MPHLSSWWNVLQIPTIFKLPDSTGRMFLTVVWYLYSVYLFCHCNIFVSTYFSCLHLFILTPKHHNSFFVWWHINLYGLYDAKGILIEERYYFTNSWEEKGVHTFSILNIIPWLVFELTFAFLSLFMKQKNTQQYTSFSDTFFEPISYTFYSQNNMCTFYLLRCSYKYKWAYLDFSSIYSVVGWLVGWLVYFTV